MSYTLLLSKDDLKYFAWIGGRYSAPELLYKALTPVDALAEDVLAEIQEDDSEGSFTVSEPEAWAIKEAWEEEGGFTCLDPDSSLGKKLATFIDSIV